jgi:hypothetical protein
MHPFQKKGWLEGWKKIILKKREVGKVATHYIGECDYTRD